MSTTTRRIVLLSVAAVAGVVVLSVVRQGSRESQPHPSATEAQQSAYADPAACATCHAEIAATYSLTGMGRSFARVRPDALAVELKSDNRLHHAASGRSYTTSERDGRIFQRRHQIGHDGAETNVLELEAHYVVGSGNHARTFLHRTGDGRLLELPISWYAERGGFWAMSPGYDRPAHQDFRRLINNDCMGCHNGYPREALADEGNGPRFAESLPSGIDCQRCHGPGQAHIDAIGANQLEAARKAIMNPARLDRDRQLETCMQCHLEPTSSPLPFQIRRYGQPAFSYIPGKPLGDHAIYFDHAPGTGRDDKFEIASGAYRLRKSACFQRSEMTCLTCHNPHDVPRGEKAAQQYVAACQGCHKSVHPGGVPRVEGVAAGATCIDCHMPKRRTEDAVHVVMTDHYIQRRQALTNLLAPRSEAENFDQGTYRGDVVLYYPPALPPTPDSELYVALAQVQQGANLAAGIPRLEQAIAKHQPKQPEFYYELARAYSKTSDDAASIKWCEEALRRDPSFAPALKEMAAAATRAGTLAPAAQALEKAVALRPRDGLALADLGNVYLLQGRVDDARRVLQDALRIDAAMPGANNTMALVQLRQSETVEAEKYLRVAIRHQPDLAEAQNNLGNLLAGRKAYREANFHFEQAIASNPNYVDAHHSYGMVLALTGAYAQAETALRHAVRLAPRLAAPHLDLADVLAAQGRVADAAREYELTIALSTDAESRRVASESLRALRK